MSTYRFGWESDEEDTEPLEAIVFDNGSYHLRGGVAGADQPSVQVQSAVGRPRQDSSSSSVLGKSDEKDFYIGFSATQRELLSIKYPIEHGIITNWDDMEQLWWYTLDELKAKITDRPWLHIVRALNPKENHEKMLEVLFEGFDPSNLLLVNAELLDAYATGRTTALSLDIGEGVCTAYPLIEGFGINQAILRKDFGGRDVLNHLIKSLNKSQGTSFTLTRDIENVRSLKQELCYVVEADFKAPMIIETQEYTLPDDKKISVGEEKYMSPEILFRPELMGRKGGGVVKVVVDAIMRADVDSRSLLWENVILSGGSTLFPGFQKRLLAELRAIAPSKMNVRVLDARERELNAWIGGSIMASLSSTQTLWLKREQYQEFGLSYVYRNSLAY